MNVSGFASMVIKHYSLFHKLQYCYLFYFYKYPSTLNTEQSFCVFRVLFGFYDTKKDTVCFTWNDLFLNKISKKFSLNVLFIYFSDSSLLFHDYFCNFLLFYSDLLIFRQKIELKTFFCTYFKNFSYFFLKCHIIFKYLINAFIPLLFLFLFSRYSPTYIF